MTATKNMDMELMPFDSHLLDEEPQSSSSVLGEQMDWETCGNSSDVSPKIYEVSVVVVLILQNTTTNGELILSMKPLSESSACRDVNLLHISSPTSSPESQDMSSPLSLIPSIPTNESDGIQASGPILVPLGQTTTTEEFSRISSPCLLVSSPGKEKRTKSYRTKKTLYSRDESTKSINKSIDILAQLQQLRKEAAEQKKQEDEHLLKENARLKKKFKDIQRENQYLKNLLIKSMK